jgi:hypothetical protein
MSYSTSIQTPAKAYYAAVVDGFYTQTVFNPAKNQLVSVSNFPIQASLLAGAEASGMAVTETLTCASQNPAYRCVSPMDCPGPNSSCGRCVNHQCQK